MPDMILHYIADHEWRPPQEFIDDVINAKIVDGERMQTKSLSVPPRRIGYLSGIFSIGKVPKGFLDKLEALMSEAAKKGRRIQYRGYGI